MGKYNISVAGNKMKIVLEGRFDGAEGVAFTNEYQSTLKKINPAQYELEIDVRNLPTITTDKQDELKQSFKLYKSSGFKKIIMIMENNAILAMQTKRIAKEIGITDFEIR